ncbi:hypothetical protein Tco_0737104 [Tanacetum coccineum]
MMFYEGEDVDVINADGFDSDPGNDDETNDYRRISVLEAGSSTIVTTPKLPVLNIREFELWKIRIEKYFLMTDYALWEVIVNGDSPPPKRTIDGVEKTYPPTTAEEKLARKNELKARGTLLEAIEKRFGGNKESKKTQKALLKQQYGEISMIKPQKDLLKPMTEKLQKD